MPCVVQPTSVTYSGTAASPSEFIASLALRTPANTLFGVAAYGWIATPSIWPRRPGSAASMLARNQAGRVSPPTITRAPACLDRIALRAAPYRFAYAAGFGEGYQNAGLSGSFQISYVSTGSGFRPGFSSQKLPPGPYRDATAAANDGVLADRARRRVDLAGDGPRPRRRVVDDREPPEAVLGERADDQVVERPVVAAEDPERGLGLRVLPQRIAAHNGGAGPRQRRQLGVDLRAAVATAVEHHPRVDAELLARVERGGGNGAPARSLGAGEIPTSPRATAPRPRRRPPSDGAMPRSLCLWSRWLKVALFPPLAGHNGVRAPDCQRLARNRPYLVLRSAPMLIIGGVRKLLGALCAYYSRSPPAAAARRRPPRRRVEAAPQRARDGRPARPPAAVRPPEDDRVHHVGPGRPRNRTAECPSDREDRRDRPQFRLRRRLSDRARGRPASRRAGRR